MVNKDYQIQRPKFLFSALGMHLHPAGYAYVIYQIIYSIFIYCYYVFATVMVNKYEYIYIYMRV